MHFMLPPPPSDENDVPTIPRMPVAEEESPAPSERPSDRPTVPIPLMTSKQLVWGPS
jgi:hypothetical protein